MRFRFGVAVGFGIGYVLGSKAGRERYEQIRARAVALRESGPGQRVMHTANKAQHVAADKFRSMREREPEPVTAGNGVPF